MKSELWRWWRVTLMGLSSACGAGRSSNLDNSELPKSDAAGRRPCAHDVHDLELR